MSCSAIQKDHYIASPSLGKMQWEEMIEMRASNPNLLMNKKLWDWENIGNDPQDPQDKPEKKEDAKTDKATKLAETSNSKHQ